MLTRHGGVPVFFKRLGEINLTGGNIDHGNGDIRSTAVQRGTVSKAEVAKLNPNDFVSFDTPSNFCKVKRIPAVGVTPMTDFVIANNFDVLDLSRENFANK